MEWIFYPFGLLIQKIIAFIDMVINLFKFSEPHPPPDPEEPQAIVDFAEGTSPIPEVQNPDEMLDSNIVTVIFVIAGILAILVIVWICLRLRASRRDMALMDQDMEMTAADTGLPRAPREAERKSNRRKIRRIYERYLKLLRQWNFFRQPQDSSQEIIEKTQDILPEATSQALRKLYIAARYDPNAAITGAQVREAKRLLKKLTEESKT